MEDLWILAMLNWQLGWVKHNQKFIQFYWIYILPIP